MARTLLSVDLLKTFSEEELKHFSEFISCSYFNTNKTLCKLLKLLIRYVLNTEDFNDEVQLKIYEGIFTKAEKVNKLNQTQKKELNRLLNNLLVLAEDFLTVACLKKKKDKQHELLFPELIERRQLLLYNRRLKALQKELDAQQKRGTDFYTKQYHLGCYKADILYIENKLAKEDNFDDLQYHLDVKYILEKLNFHLAKISLMNAFGNKKFDLRPFEALDSLLKLPQYANNSLIRLSLLNIQLIEKEDDDTFIALSKTITKNEATIPDSLLKPFYTNLTNYCGRQLLKGRLSYYSDLFNIYKNMDCKNLLVMDDAINIGLLKNIITNACRVKEYIWAKNILKKYKSYISTKARESVFYYNYGIICFNQQKYIDALSHFNQVKKIDDIHEIGIKVTTLKCFYEIDSRFENNTKQAIKSRAIYFKKNEKLPINLRKGYYHFLKIFEKLYKIKNIQNKKERCSTVKKALPILKIELNEKTAIQEKKWLLSKITNLENVCK